jgi:hypothetical protein
METGVEENFKLCRKRVLVQFGKTPKALAKSSPGLERSDNPGNLNKKPDQR